MTVNLLEDMSNELWNSKGVIYCYTNKINGKKYVGQTKRTLKRRHNEHIWASKGGKECHFPFHRAIKKYGIENFILELLALNCESYDEMNELEEFYVRSLKTLKTQHGYNIASGGNNGNNLEGKTEEELNEFKRKLSEANKGKLVGEKNPMYGKAWSEEQRKKWSEQMSGENNPFYGKHHSEETKKKLSKLASGRTGEKNPFYGKIHSEETKEKLREKQGIPVVAVNIESGEKLFYKSVSHSAIDGFKPSHVNQCCLMNRLGEEEYLKTHPCRYSQHKGYKWYYKEDYEKLQRGE